jgi:hypothetical protein
MEAATRPEPLLPHAETLVTEYKIPELPSDDELGIAGMEEGGAEAPKRTLFLGRRRRGTPPPAREKEPTSPGGGLWMALATLLILLGLAWATSTSRVAPRAVPLTAPDSVFSSGRAMLDVAALSQRPRPLGSAEHDSARAYLAGRLVELGLTPEVQTATSLDRRSPTVLAAATVRNLLARVPGTASTGAILLTAHYDSRELSRGAGDDATGVAVVLETVRALRAGPPLRNDLIVMLSDGEEQRMMGARAFVDGHPWMQDVAVVLSVEMRGGGGPSVMFETGAENGRLVRALDQATRRAYGFSMGSEVYRRVPNDTDFTAFVEAGLNGLNFAAVGRPQIYHQAYDEPGRLDERTVQHHGIQVLGSTRVLGEQDLTQIDAADVTFLPVPLLGLVVYPTVAGYGLAAGLVVVLLIAALLLRRASGGAGGVAVGFLIVLAVLAVNGTAAYFTFLWLAQRHAEYRTLAGSAFHQEGWYAAALLGLSLATTIALLALARRRFGLGSLALGATLVPSLVALAASALAPLAAANLQWPALFTAAAAGVVAGVGPGVRLDIVRWLLLVVLAACVLAFMVPLVELLWLTFGFGAAALVGVIVATLPVLLLPLLDSFRQPSGAVASGASLTAAALFAATGQLQAHPSPERPGPSTLVWALDRDSARALWATLADGGEGWAESRAGVALAEERPLTAWMVGAGITYSTGPAPVIAIPPVEVRMLGTSSTTAAAGTSGGRRRLTVAMRSPAGAWLLGVRLPEGDVYVASVNGVEPPPASDGTGHVRDVLHYGRPEGAVTLELDVGPSVAAPAIEVIEHHLRPERLLGTRWFLRPPSLAPNVIGRSDRAATRATVLLEPAALAIDSVLADSTTAPPPR